LNPLLLSALLDVLLILDDPDDLNADALVELVHQKLNASLLQISDQRIDSFLVGKAFARLEMFDRAQPDIGPLCQLGLRYPEPLCVPKTLSELMRRWNRLSWRNDQAVLFRSGRPGLAVQVEGTA